MKIDTLILGSYQTNCYVVRKDDQTSDCVLIDTGLEAEDLIHFLQEQDFNPVAVILTHGHADHIAGLIALRQNYPEVKVCIYTADAEMLSCSTANLCALAGVQFSTAPAEVVIEAECEIEFAQIKFKVLHTPGHTPGGICLYDEQEGILFSGDTLFCQSIGRTDFPGGDFGQLISAVKEKIFTLPDKTVVYPGHGPVTNIGQEKASNPFLQN